MEETAYRPMNPRNQFRRMPKYELGCFLPPLAAAAGLAIGAYLALREKGAFGDYTEQRIEIRSGK